MELVPILSTIILVGTVATFLLAVFAYILYKWRERHNREETPTQRIHEQDERHVLVEPAGPFEPAPSAEPARPAAPEGPTPTSRPGSLFWEYTGEGFVPVSPVPSSERSGEGRAEPTADTGSAWI
jgi:hypothetical protein